MAQDYHLDLQKGSIKGESMEKGYEGQIQLLSWSWGATQTGSFAHGSGGGAGVGGTGVGSGIGAGGGGTGAGVGPGCCPSGCCCATSSDGSPVTTGVWSSGLHMPGAANRASQARRCARPAGETGTYPRRPFPVARVNNTYRFRFPHGHPAAIWRRVPRRRDRTPQARPSC